MLLRTLSDSGRGFPSKAEPLLHFKGGPPDAREISSSNYRSSADSIVSEGEAQKTRAQEQIARSLANPDAKTWERLEELNRKRQAQGQAPIDLRQTTQQLEAIASDSSLSAKEKKTKIEELRKSLGLSKKDMKRLFTRRLQSAYKQADKSLAAFQKAKETQLQGELRRQESLYGKDSAQAKAVKDKLSDLKGSIEPERRRLHDRSAFYGSVYPSFWAKLGGFFKKIGGAFSKVLGVLGNVLRFLPGIGPLASRALGSVKYLFNGQVGKFFSNLGKGILETVENWKDFLPLIPGVGAIAGFAVQGIEAVLKKTRGGTKFLQ